MDAADIKGRDIRRPQVSVTDLVRSLQVGGMRSNCALPRVATHVGLLEVQVEMQV